MHVIVFLREFSPVAKTEIFSISLFLNGIIVDVLQWSIFTMKVLITIFGT